MRNTLYKAYLDDFAAFCAKLGGTTAEVCVTCVTLTVG
jgi:V-type H+-transporting ATPase subunit d